MYSITAGTPGTDASRISDANAFSSYLLYKLKYRNLTITPGLRYESISLGRKDFGKNDVSREGIDLSTRENQVNVWIPGMGLNYNFNRISIFGGIHKGFSPPTSKEGEQPEESVNYELGSRFTLGNFSGELVGFFNDYSNLLGSDLAATGGTGSLEQFNAGEVNVTGLEVLLNYNALNNHKKLRLPITVAYTLTNAEFRSSFDSPNDIWGEVTKGDEKGYFGEYYVNRNYTQFSQIENIFDIKL